MSTYNTAHYKINYSRYQHYYRQIWRFYEKPTAKISAALVLTILTIIFFAVFAIRPTLITIAELLKTIHDRQEVLVQLETKSESLAKAQQSYLEYSDTLNRLQTAIPADTAVPDLITAIEALAAKHQLSLNSLTLGEFSFDSSPNTFSEPQLFPFSLAVNGEYQSLQNFLNDVLAMPRFITVEAVSFGNANDNTDTNPTSLQLNIQLHSYYQTLD